MDDAGADHGPPQFGLSSATALIPFAVSGSRDRGRGEPKTGRPAVGLAVQPVDLDIGEREVESAQQRLGLLAVEAQPIAAQLGQPPLRAEPLKAE